MRTPAKKRAYLQSKWCLTSLVCDVDHVERFRLTLRFFDDVVIYFFNSDFKFFD